MASSVGTSSISRSSAHSMGFFSVSSSSSPFGDTNIDTDGFLKSSRRAGGPFLCSLPSALIPAHDLPIPGNDSAMRHEIEMTAREVLNELHLEFLECQVNGRRSKVEPEPEFIPTVVIQMPNRPQAELWCHAAREVHQRLEGRGHSGFSVELIEAALLRGIYCSPVEPSHSIFSKWRNIVEEIIQRSDTREWTGMDCWRYGTNVDRKSNPVTVIVRVARSSKGPFTTASRSVHGILASFDEADVDVLFQKDGKRRFEENPTLPLESTSGRVYPGVSIGIHNSEAGSSTLGGLVQLRFKGKSDWSTYGLTCFHCIWPSENHREDPKMRTPEAKDALQRWMNRPLTMRDNPSLGNIAKRILRVDHPLPRDLRTTIESLNTAVEQVRSPMFWHCKKEIDKGDNGCLPDSARREYEQMLKVIRAFEDKREPYSQMLTNGSYYLGHIVAGSGMNRVRVNKDRLRVAVDWALIQINQNRIHRQTQGEVVIGNTGIFPVRRQFDPGAGLFYTNDRAFESGVILTKSGRSTHLTSAKCNILKSVELDRLKSSQGPGYGLVVSWSTKIPAGANHFTEPGDSGAWIFSHGGYLFGIVTGGDVAQGTTYVCRTEDIFSDIKDINGAVDVRIAPSSAS